jgi:phosphoglycerate dehydrogenase-like enzyme
MRIVFHGQNAANFIPGFRDLVGPGHEIAGLPDHLAASTDVAAYQAADVIVGIRLDKQLPPLTKIKLYHAPAAGIDAIDPSLLPAGTPVCNCFGHEHAIAEYVMTALLLRHVPIPDADRRLRQGDWHYWGKPAVLRTELGSGTIGLLGFGHIGKAIASRAKAFGMRVTVCNRTAVPPGPLVDQSFMFDRLRDFMASADAIVVSLPHVPETTGFVGAAEIAAMRPTALILNVGRGPVIDETALYDALADKRIGGAIIDTWYQYPTAGNATPQPSRLSFAELDNVVMTPHMSGWTHEMIRRRQQTVAENIRRLAASLPLINCVA